MNRRRVFCVVLVLSLSACERLSPFDPQGRYDKAQRELTEAATTQLRFYALPEAAKASVDTGKTTQADTLARELLALADQFRADWNYGNAIHDAHVVLGRLALLGGDHAAAKQHLLQAGDTPGSPQLDSFGPNMTLARDLIRAGERDTVIQYFEKCRRFWKDDFGALKEWEDAVRRGGTPDFRANLFY